MIDAEDTAVIDERPGALPPELAELAGLASAADAQVRDAALPPGAEPPVPIDRGQEYGAMLSMVVTMAAPALPFLPQCYTDETCTRIGTAFAAVADKRGWNLGALASPELALAVVALPPTITAIVLGKRLFAERAAAEAIEKARKAAAAPAPELKTGAHGGIIVVPG